MRDSQNSTIRSYGRVRGRNLSGHQQHLYDTLLPHLLLDIKDINAPKSILSGRTECWLEIGFGGGEHLAAQAKARPDIGFVGCEVFENGIAKLLTQIDKSNLENIRLYSEDARELLEQLPPNSLDRVFVLFPDPWPKTKHHKRRLITKDFLQLIHTLLKDGGKLRVATDHMPYLRWILEKIQRHEGFLWTARKAEDWRAAPADHFTTRYEEKLKAGTKPVFIDLVKQ